MPCSDISIIIVMVNRTHPVGPDVPIGPFSGQTGGSCETGR